jgi:protein TonB
MVAIVTGAPHSSPLQRAFFIALMGEIALIGLAGWLMTRDSLPLPPLVQPMRLQLVELPPAPPLPEIRTPSPPPEQKPKMEQKPAPSPVPKSVVKPLPSVLPVVPPSPAPMDPAPVAMLAAEASPASAPPPTRANQDVTADFESKVRTAIQSVLRYPVAAKALGREGRVRVSFDFIDGQASDIHVVDSADLEAFDHAALVAVQEARFPAAPLELNRQMLHFSIWVEFFKKR